MNTTAVRPYPIPLNPNNGLPLFRLKSQVPVDAPRRVFPFKEGEVIPDTTHKTIRKPTEEEAEAFWSNLDRNITGSGNGEMEAIKARPYTPKVFTSDPELMKIAAGHFSRWEKKQAQARRLKRRYDDWENTEPGRAK